MYCFFVVMFSLLFCCCLQAFSEQVIKRSPLKTSPSKAPLVGNVRMYCFDVSLLLFAGLHWTNC